MIITFSTARVYADECAGKSVINYPKWNLLKNNAVRTGNSYAVARNPKAFLISPEVKINYQVAGEFQGSYLITFIQEGAAGVTFMMLRPNFDFCENPRDIDDTRDDLFDVFVAKFNGRPF